MTAESYLTAWIWYLGASLLLLGVFWYITRRLSALIKLPLRAVVAAVLLAPATAASGHPELAPAWLVSAFDGVMQDDIGFLRGARPMLFLLVVFLLSAAINLWFSAWRLRRKAGQASAGADSADDEEVADARELS